LAPISFMLTGEPKTTWGGWLYEMILRGYSTYFKMTFPLFSNPVTYTLTISPIDFLFCLMFLILSSSLMTPETPRLSEQKTIRFWMFLMNAKM
jgi:beta-glucosidase/6-phospho-beta-glucosidase/beta-galactosidase